MLGKISIVVGAVIVTSALVIGCSSDSPTGAVATQDALVRTVPMDGADNVDLMDSVYMHFNEPVDMDHFDEWFYCLDSASHDALEDSLHGHMMGMGGMHMDSTMFYERMHERGVPGAFHWNGDGDSCVFIPGDDWMPGTQYVLRFSHGMQSRSGHHMENMGAVLSDDYRVRFRTVGSSPLAHRPPSAHANPDR